MAKSKKKESGKAANRINAHKVARQAGKIAAQAERIARDAVDKAVQASSMVVDIIGHPSHAADAIGGAVSAGRKTVVELGSGAQDLIESGTHTMTQLVDDRVRATLASLGLASRQEVDALRRRISEVEGGGRKALPPKKAAARKPAAKKAAAKKPAAKKPAAKKAAAKPAAKKAAAKPAAKKAAAKPAAKKAAARKPAARKA
jgi:hypothetical protein